MAHLISLDEMEDREERREFTEELLKGSKEYEMKTESTKSSVKVTHNNPPTTKEQPILITKWMVETSVYPNGTVVQKTYPLRGQAKGFAKKKKRGKKTESVLDTSEEY